MPSRYNATLAGIPLKIQDIGDGFPKSIAKHEFPNRDGALLEDMGQKARSIRFRCYFWDETYERHNEVVALLSYRGNDIELQHPKYGILYGSIEDVSVHHDDRQDTAEVDITFLRNIPDESSQPYPEVGAATEAAYVDGQAEQMAHAADDIANDIEGGSSLLDTVIEAGQGVLEQFSAVSGALHDYVATIDTCVSQYQAVLASIENPANSLISAIEYTTDLPGVIVGSLANMVERYSILYDSIRTAPDRFVQSLRDGILQLRDALPDAEPNPARAAAIATLRRHIEIALAQRLCLDLGSLYKADETRRQIRRRSERTKTFDAQGKYVGPAAGGSSTPILTINEIERSLSTTRESVQTAVESARGMQSLKNMARTLLDHVNVIKLEREKIVVKDVGGPLPLHALCLREGLPYNYAERITAINTTIKNPNFISGEVSLYVR